MEVSNGSISNDQGNRKAHIIQRGIHKFASQEKRIGYWDRFSFLGAGMDCSKICREDGGRDNEVVQPNWPNRTWPIR